MKQKGWGIENCVFFTEVSEFTQPNSLHISLHALLRATKFSREGERLVPASLSPTNMPMTHQQSSEPLFWEQVTKIEPADLKAPAENGTYVHGLYLEGAAWSKKEGKLVDSAPKVLLLSK